MMRFATLGGATVTVERDSAYSSERFVWRCGGCVDTDGGLVEPVARRDANKHAGQCRSIPPTQN